MNEEPSSYLPSSGILTAKPVSFEVTPAMLRSQLRHGSIAKPTNDSSHRQKIRNRAISSMKDEQLSKVARLVPLSSTRLIRILKINSGWLRFCTHVTKRPTFGLLTWSLEGS